MALLRSILLIFALLAQALPVQAMMHGSEAETCEMGCCATVTAEMEVCACTDSSAPAKPAKAPPASGREVLPQIVWVLLQESPLMPRASDDLENSTPLTIERGLLTQPHVRLPVLFCTFLN